ncbi:MAG: hypothetical protein HYX48_05730 [Chlamydiales bacterium]|nr:hypothetical protein [Chlamydiales bacterium]
MKKTLIVYLLFFASLLPLYRFCMRETAGFSISKISFALPENVDGPSEFDREILNQPFHFLGSGGQCFAFVSKDEKYVIKLLSRGVAPTFLLDLPLPAFVKRAVAKRADYVESKWQRDQCSYQLALSELKEESGLLAVHLSHTSDLNKRLSIRDKLGIAHEIDLDSTAFILQKWAEPLFTYLEHEIRAGHIEEAKLALKQTVDLLVRRCQKGIFDEDPRLHKNLGIAMNSPLFIDVGRFKRDDRRKNPEVYAQDLKLITDRLNKWLLKEEPQLANYLEELLAQD